MAQLTLARFRGDTSFGFVARVVSTFGGGIVGMAMWFVSICISIFFFYDILTGMSPADRGKGMRLVWQPSAPSVSRSSSSLVCTSQVLR